MRPRSGILPLFIILFGLLSVTTLRSIDITYGTNQLLFFISGAAAYWTASQFDFFWLRRTRWFWYGLVIALLVLTLVIGKATNGSVSWIRLGSYRLQPSEFLKPALVLLLAVEAARRPLKRWKGVGRFAVLAAAPLALVLFQPDFGTAAVTLAGVTAVYLLSGARRQHVLLLLALSLAAAALCWSLVFKPYQRDRIRTFLDPSSDSLGSGYNAQQAIIAVGAGGWLGTGFGKGAQSHLRFLPERQTDFLFATYAEETGLAGTLLLIGLYGGLFAWSAWKLGQLRGAEKVAVGGGILAMLLVQSFINIGMNLGIAPITGVTLPFFSLGGSSLMASALSLGMLESLRRSDPLPTVSLT